MAELLNFRLLNGEVEASSLWYMPGEVVSLEFDETTDLTLPAMEKLQAISQEEVVQLKIDPRSRAWDQLAPLHSRLSPLELENTYELA